MKTLFKNASSILTLNTSGQNFKRGKQMNDLGMIKDCSILVEDGIIADLVKPDSLLPQLDNEYDLSGKTILPGLIECHTHTAFAGSRADEFRQKLSGTAYETIAKKGGGINTTVKAVRETSFEDLLDIIKPRINNFLEQGVTTLEIKSGYGLSFYDEVKLLQVIRELNKTTPVNLIATFLGAHTFPPEYKNDPDKYIAIIIDELIPYIAKNKMAEFCDVFCEKSALNTTQVEKIFIAAKAAGLKLKIHTDQFNDIGGIDLAIKYETTSADHLEVVSEENISKLSNKEIPLVLLPGVSFFLNYQFAPARKLIDSGAIVALSTDYNPGSSNIASLPLIMSIAALKMKMSVEEVISAVTINSAKALDIQNKTGSIEIGKAADFAIFDTTNYTDIIYNIGLNLNYMTVKNGVPVFTKSFG